MILHVKPPTTVSRVDKGKVTFVELMKQWVLVSTVPTMLPTIPATLQTESATTSTISTLTPMTVAPEVPPIVEPMPKAPTVISLPTTKAPT